MTMCLLETNCIVLLCTVSFLICGRNTFACVFSMSANAYDYYD